MSSCVLILTADSTVQIKQNVALFSEYEDGHCERLPTTKGLRNVDDFNPISSYTGT
jgi:hypothetical protein